MCKWDRCCLSKGAFVAYKREQFREHVKSSRSLSRKKSRIRAASSRLQDRYYSRVSIYLPIIEWFLSRKFWLFEFLPSRRRFTPLIVLEKFNFQDTDDRSNSLSLHPALRRHNGIRPRNPLPPSSSFPYFLSFRLPGIRRIDVSAFRDAPHLERDQLSNNFDLNSFSASETKLWTRDIFPENLTDLPWNVIEIRHYVGQMFDVSSNRLGFRGVESSQAKHSPLIQGYRYFVSDNLLTISRT